MKLYSSNEHYQLYQGNMLDMLEVIEPESIDSIVTDPPYELNFMNKGWDNSGVAFQKSTWKRCFEVLKPGGYLLAFGGSRTYHRIACAIEDAGFEIRDTIMWLYGSGFPKSMNIALAFDKAEGLQGQRGIGGFNVGGLGEQENRKSKLYIGSTTDGSKQEEYTDAKGENAKKWAGWGTALKPAYEPIIVARKPFNTSVTDNILKYGVGGINIDECRVEEKSDSGRFPSNVILTYDKTDEKEVCGGMPYSESNGGMTTMPKMGGGELGVCNYQTVGAERVATNYVAPQDSGSASRYFYCAKASKKDRDEGLNAFATQKTGDLQGGRQEGSAGSIMQNANGGTRVNPYAGTGAPKKNTHPTVKPTELMQYLIRLVTPNGGTVLDPFNGSGSTGKAVMYENVERNKDYKYIGIELTEEYLPIAKARIEYVGNTSVVVYETVDNGETAKKLEIESLF